jgi:hypothetical protein
MVVVSRNNAEYDDAEGGDSNQAPLSQISNSSRISEFVSQYSPPGLGLSL